MPIKHLLTINSGSSSIKFALFEMDQNETLVFIGKIERIGIKGSHFKLNDSSGKSLIDEEADVPNHQQALQHFFDWFDESSPIKSFDAVGHRIVHGGSEYTQPQIIDDQLINGIKTLIPFAPEHLPHEILAIEFTAKRYTKVKQVACFDTSFHRKMPRIAQIYGIPRKYFDEGIVHYGFHGLSYEYIMQALRKENGDHAADSRVIIAHLGNGSSMAAILNGISQETTMGFTPTGGLIMSSRSGDLDPGIILYLLRTKKLNADQLNILLNKQSGLLGVSGLSSDIQDLLGKSKENPEAAEAIDLYCYQAKKYLGSLYAVLGALDTLVFTAGIGENNPIIRRKICSGLEYMGIELDPERNKENSSIISKDGSKVIVRVMKTDEELMIARHSQNILNMKNTKNT